MRVPDHIERCSICCSVREQACLHLTKIFPAPAGGCVVVVVQPNSVAGALNLGSWAGRVLYPADRIIPPPGTYSCSSHMCTKAEKNGTNAISSPTKKFSAELSPPPRQSTLQKTISRPASLDQIPAQSIAQILQTCPLSHLPPPISVPSHHKKQSPRCI